MGIRGIPFVILYAAGLSAFASQSRTDEEAREALPAEWRDVKHLPDGFPPGFEPPLAARIPDGKGGVIDLSRGELRFLILHAGTLFRSRPAGDSNP